MHKTFSKSFVFFRNQGAISVKSEIVLFAPMTRFRIGRRRHRDKLDDILFAVDVGYEIFSSRQRGSTTASERRRTQPDECSVASFNRRFSSPRRGEYIREGQPTDDQRFAQNGHGQFFGPSICLKATYAT